MKRIEQPIESIAGQSVSFNQARLTTHDAGRDETTGASAPDSDFPGEAELKAAIAHFGFSAGRIGAPAEYKSPFTRQLKSDTALRFDVDKAHFDEANQVEGEVIRSYLRLRLATFALFVAALVLQVCLFEAAFGDAAAANASSLTAGLLVLGVSGLAFGTRIGVRRVWFYVLSQEAQQLSFKIFTHLHEISTRVTEVCAKVRDRVGKGGDWPTRARKWTIVALWNAKRGEYLDRFVTTVIWKVRTAIQQIENGSLIIKVLTVAGVALVLLSPSIPSIVFLVLLMVQTYWLWHWLGRQPPDFWEKQFRKSAPHGDDEGETYIDKISGVVENLVHEALSKEFGQGAGKKP